MAILSDEPLIDDSALDDFDWSAVPAPKRTNKSTITRRSNMKAFMHRAMLTSALLASYATFKLASLALSWAGYHKRKLNDIDRREEVEFYNEMFAWEHKASITPGTHADWLDANPVDMGRYDRAHPDYTDEYYTGYANKPYSGK